MNARKQELDELAKMIILISQYKFPLEIYILNSFEECKKENIPTNLENIQAKTMMKLLKRPIDQTEQVNVILNKIAKYNIKTKEYELKDKEKIMQNLYQRHLQISQLNDDEFKKFLESSDEIYRA